jgi:uncharacterized protein (TIGR04255 family)
VCKVSCKIDEEGKMSRKMKNPPVFYTVAQVKFNPVLDMQDFMSRLQKKWRPAFPDFSQDAVSEIQVHLAGPGQAPEVKTLTNPRWNFKNIEKTSGYALGTNFLTFQTTSYEDSDHFIANLVSALATLDSIVKLAYIESLSIRMLDAIVPNDGEDLSKYLKTNLLSLAGKLNGECLQAISQLVMDTGDSTQLTSKLVLLRGRIGLPQELAPLPLMLNARALAINGPHVILDNDCTQNKRMPIDLDDVTKRFRSVKAQISKAFFETVSDEAKAIWG